MGPLHYPARCLPPSSLALASWSAVKSRDHLIEKEMTGCRPAKPWDTVLLFSSEMAGKPELVLVFVRTVKVRIEHQKLKTSCLGSGCRCHQLLPWVHVLIPHCLCMFFYIPTCMRTYELMQCLAQEHFKNIYLFVYLFELQEREKEERMCACIHMKSSINWFAPPVPTTVRAWTG